jgi:hypothetical protein
MRLGLGVREEANMGKLVNYAAPVFCLVAALFGMTAEFSFSTDWRAVNTGMSSRDIRALSIDPVDPFTLYAGTADGAFKSSDGGASWHRLPLSGNPVIALVVDPSNPGTLYAAIALPNFCVFSNRRVFKSVDRGTTWSSNASPPINGCDNIHALVMDPTHSGTLYVANYDDVSGDTWSPLIKSADGGATWKPLYGIPFDVLVVNPLNPNILYAGTLDFVYFGYEGFDHRNGVLKSTDGGEHWSSTGLTNTAVNVLAIDPVNPNILYAGTRGLYNDPKGFRGLFKSADGGISWSSINNGLTDLIGTGSIVTAVVIHPGSLNILYISTSGGGVFKSGDGGASWSSFNEGLTNLEVPALAKAPDDPITLYAGTSGGVFRIIDDTPALTLESKEYCIGEPWRLTLRNGAPNASVRLLGTSNARSWEIPIWSQTDASGTFTAEGTFAEGTEGSHTLRVEIDGVSSNSVSFVVSNCKPQ